MLSKKIRTMSVILLLALFMFPKIASANPIFGSETETNTEACGECDCTYATTTTCIFWIPISSNPELTDVDCPTETN
jgi:hypothetical protein